MSDTNGDYVNDGFTTIPDVSIDAVANRVAPRQVASGMTRGIQQLGSDKVYSDGGNQQIIVEDTTIPRVMMGNQATFGEGFYVTKDGFNVKTNTNPANFIFNSSQNVFKIVSSVSGSMTVTVSSGVTTKIIPHNLGYIPAILAYISDGTSYSQLPSILSSSAGATVISIATFAYVGVDVVNVSIQVETAGSTLVGAVLPYKYYLLQETAS